MIQLFTIGLAVGLHSVSQLGYQGAAGFPAGTSVILSDSAPGVLKQCTRQTPTHIEGFWTPTDSLVRTLEAPLEALLRDVLPRVQIHGRHEATPRPSDYYRQYVGVIQGGRRMVYVNGFAAEFVATLDTNTFYWKQRPVDVCDGGAWFFGVLYDVDARTFEKIEFNDSISGRVRY